jgi:LPXTG-site transpeptidase (sortase) family protein
MKVDYNNIMNKMLHDKAVGVTVLGVAALLLLIYSFTINARSNNIKLEDMGAFKAVNSWVIGLVERDDDGDLKEEGFSVFAEKLEPIHSDPRTLNIEKLGVTAEVVRVGVDETGTMETPSNWVDIGWFENSAKPGENGNFILNGHFDTNYGGPAVFWQLKNIQVGDKVSVIDEYGKTYTYEANESFYVDIDDPNRLDVLKSDESKSTMTLITCGGVWVPGVSTYNKRLIVKAELVK